MAEVFTWKHKPGATGTHSFKVIKASFGDGYEQSMPDGLNNKSQTWPLTFEGTEAQIQPIYDFLDRHKGAKSFLWKPPLSPQALFKVEQFTVTSIGAGVYSLSAEFRQCFVP